MTRILYIFKETVRSLGRNPMTALASFLSLALLFLLFDLFWVAAGTSQQFYRNLVSQIRVEAYVEESVPDSMMTAIASDVRSVEGVMQVTAISRDSARARLIEMLGSDLLMGYDEVNPLPRSFVLSVDDASLSSAALGRIENELQNIEGIGEVHYSRDWLLKAEATKRLMWQVGLILGILIVAAAVISSANNIRLMTRARAVGFRQMLLLGAGRIFIAFPFVVEGFLLSGLAAAAGWGVVFYGRTRIAFSQVSIIYPATDPIVFYCLAAGLLGAISGYLGLRRQLKV